MMEANLESLRAQQREAWDQFSPGWNKWDRFLMEWLQPLGEELINSSGIVDGIMVLDVATGTGEPGLMIAERFPNTQVSGIDISAEMLKVAKVKAASRGLTNYENFVSDEASLPFGDDHFDAVVCRLGLMFFADMSIGIREMKRVLKPGKQVALTVWGPKADNPWAPTIGSVVQEVLNLTPPPPEAPGIFRCEEKGMVAELLSQEGFVDIEERELKGTRAYESPERYWEMMTEVAAPISMALESAHETQIELIERRVLDAAAALAVDGKPEFGWLSYVVSARKP